MPSPNPVYRGMDQATLDAQYDARAAVPDHAERTARRALWSMRARTSLACDLDVHYGAGARETLDIFPAAQPGAPVEVYIHGGFWRAKSKSDVSFIAEAMVPAGVTFVAIEYDLVPNVTLDVIVAQSRAAVAWVYRNIGRYGGDPARIHVSGVSAGAHLGAMVLATPWQTMHGLPEDLVKGACLVSGFYDLEPIRLTSENRTYGLDVAGARLNSPILHIPTHAGPLVLAVGDGETPEFRRQTADFEAAWQAAGHACTLIEAPGLHHYDMALEAGNATGPIVRAVLAGIGRMA